MHKRLRSTGESENAMSDFKNFKFGNVNASAYVCSTLLYVNYILL